MTEERSSTEKEREDREEKRSVGVYKKIGREGGGKRRKQSKLGVWEYHT